MLKDLIPLTIIDMHGDGYHIVLPVLIGKSRVMMILDTGASTTVFDRVKMTMAFSDLKINNTDQLTTGLGTSSMPSASTIIPEIWIGKIRILKLRTALIDLSHINAAYAKIKLEPVMGVLGNDILKKYRAIIDYQRECLIIEEPEPAPGPLKLLLDFFFK